MGLEFFTRWTWKNGVHVYVLHLSPRVADLYQHPCVVHLSLQWCSDIYQVGITDSRHWRVHAESISVFSSLPNRQPRLRGSSVPRVVCRVCPCSAFSEFLLTWKQGENTLRSSLIWPQVSVSGVHLNLTPPFWAQGLPFASFFVWSDYLDYELLITEAQLYQEPIICSPPR